ncbi:MAG: pectinacetylesterase family protein [Myxococcales bacterium]|nr:pectinacetylesterase family protein [Myxococcales bacterium]
MITAMLWSAGPAVAQDWELLLDVLVDGGNDYAWEQIELDGTVCGDGSQYKFYVHDSATSDNLLWYFEGGGACWTWEGCTGAAGVLSAANPNGIPDDYIFDLRAQFATPIVNGADPGIPLRSRTDLPTKDWDIVFMPYCTGDVHTGDSVVVYEDPAGVEPDLTWNHAGGSNTLEVIDYMADRFPDIGKLLVSGYSAGGAGTGSNYYVIRTALDPAQGYLLNDSGPLYPAPDATFNSRELHDTITTQWGVSNLFDLLPDSFDPDDYGTINDMLSVELPDDQIAYTAYSSDYNYSRFSYESFDASLSQSETLDLWQEDQALLLDQLGDYDNTSWHVPWERPINDSHCTSIITFIGSHACEQMEKKRRWWEYFEWPWGQDYKCYSEFVPMETFLERWIEDDEISRIEEPENGYNDDDIGMSIVAPLINEALAGI